MTGNLKRLRPYEQPVETSQPLLIGGSDAAAKGFFGFAAFWLLTATGIATLFILQLAVASFEFVLALPFGLTIEITPDTVSAGFRHAFLWGWLANAALGAVFFLTPRMTGRPLRRVKTGVLGMATWNVGFAAGLTLLYLPAYADIGLVTAFPLPVNIVLLAGLVMVSTSFWSSVTGGDDSDQPFVGLAWFGVAMLTLIGLAAEATVVGVLNLEAPTDALAEAVWLRLFVLLFGLGVPIGALHYLVPRLTGRPLASGVLAWSALAGWAVLGTIAGFGAAVYPSVPYALTSAGNAATIMLLVPTMAIVANLVMSISGRWTLVLSPGPMALALASLVFLGGSVVLAGIGSLRSVQEALAYTAWPAGLAAFTLAGAATAGLLAVAEHAWPRMLRRSGNTGVLAYVVTWSALGGAALAGTALMAAGLFQLGLTGDDVVGEEAAATLFPLYLAAWAGMGLVGLAAVAHGLSAYLLAAHGRPVQTTAPGSSEASGAAAPSPAPAGH